MRRALAAAVLALIAAVPVARADQRDQRLPGLFDQLRSSGSDVEAKAIETTIWQIWSDGGDAATNALMARGLQAMADDEETQALAVFDEMVKQRPDFAEGWNKRATVYFLLGDFTSSIADIEKTLQLEPRHFGALSGLGQIYLALDRKDAAIKAFEAALAIDPHLSSVRAAIEDLKKQRDGDPT